MFNYQLQSNANVFYILCFMIKSLICVFKGLEQLKGD